MYKLHYNLDVEEEITREAYSYCRNNYREILKIQIYLSDIFNISMSYTDSISVSEMEYLLKMASEYLKEKDEAQSKPI